MIYLLRLIWAIIFSIMDIIIDIISLIFTFKYVFGIEVDTMDSSFLKPIDTLGEYGLWKSRLHWAFKIAEKRVLWGTDTTKGFVLDDGYDRAEMTGKDYDEVKRKDVGIINPDYYKIYRNRTYE